MEVEPGYMKLFIGIDVRAALILCVYCEMFVFLVPNFSPFGSSVIILNLVVLNNYLSNVIEGENSKFVIFKKINISKSYLFPFDFFYLYLIIFD